MAERENYTGKAVFVAGGSSGINLALAQAFARQGARVAIASRSPERVEAAVAGLRAQGLKAWGYSADVRDADAIGTALEQAHRQIGDFDVLVSGAAGNFVAPALGMSAKGFRTVVDIDLVGTFNVLRQGHAFLRKPGACALNISAPQAFNPTMYQAHVCAAKAGVDMLTRVLARSGAWMACASTPSCPARLPTPKACAAWPPRPKRWRPWPAPCPCAVLARSKKLPTWPCSWARRARSL